MYNILHGNPLVGETLQMTTSDLQDADFHLLS